MIDLRRAMRTLTKTPFVTAVAVLSLALGIGANAAIFSLFDQMLLRPLPVRAPDQLVNLVAPGPKPGAQSCNQAGDCDATLSYAMFRDLEQAGGPFAGVAAHRSFGANLAFEDQTLSASGMLVSGSYFPLLGVNPALGRVFGVSDDENIGEHSVVVLSYNYWENRLGKDPAILNQTLIVNGHPLTVVGVAAKNFVGTTLGVMPDVFVPLTMRAVMEPYFRDAGFENRQSYWTYVFARLKPGVTIEKAAQDINTVYAGIINEVEAPLQEGMSDATMTRFKEKRLQLEAGHRGQSSLHREARTPLNILFGITGVVLLIACANIANLLLARGAGRSQEMAIRGSLGASRTHLVGQLLTESVLLAILGGVASLVVARWTLAGITSMMPADVVASMQLQLSPTVAAFAGALALGTGLLFGFYPALHASRADLVTMLKASAGQPSGAKAAARFRASLVTAQIALSMALLVAAGLFIKSLVNVSRVDLGLETRNIVAFGISPLLNGYEAERSLALFQQAEEELAAIPGVTLVSAALVPVLGGSSWGTNVAVEGFQRGPDTDTNANFNQVGPQYLATLGMPLLAGREFDQADAEGAPKVAIINEAFARKFNLDPHQAVGKFMSAGIGPNDDELDTQIVGVMRDAKYNDVKQAVPPVFFTPYRQGQTAGFINFYVRTSLETDQLLKAIPEVVRRIDPNLPVEDLKTLDRQVRENTFADRLISTLAAAFAGIATLLAAVGLYGVLAYTVAQRTREIGLRMALGAAAGQVRGMVLKQVTLMLVVGGVIGVVAALALGKAAQALLFGMEGNDPWVVTTVAVLLGAIALGAGYLPARRASMVDPMLALRQD
ncbi:MAG TPA: ABC transporter permease [Longimicrobiales bacterium]|nr:ABC transporter permease [Longimicrobiales bacterium]